MQSIKFEVSDDGIAVITLDAQGESVNLVSPPFIEEFTRTVERVATSEAIKGAIVTSAKSSFMPGADLKYLGAAFDKGMSEQDAYIFASAPSRMHRRMETCGKPFVCALNGTALGGGYELALACHHRILVDNPSAQIGLPEVNVGLVPGSGGTQRLARIVGVERALDLLLSGRSVPPAEALALGLVDRLVVGDELMAAARAWLAGAPSAVRDWDKKGYSAPGSAGALDHKNATLFAMQSAAIARETLYNYPAPIAIAACVFEGVQLPMDSALDLEAKHFGKLLAGSTARNIIRTSFLNKRRADSLSQRPADVARHKVAKVGVLGAGMMGAGIALASASAGISVVLIDTTLELAEKGKAYARSALAKDVERGKRSREQAETIVTRITPSVSYDQLADADMVIEAVFENPKVKADVTQRAAAVLPSTAVFATNTSTLPITDLSRAFVRPADFIGIHFFSPVERMTLVEIIKGADTSPQTLARAMDYVGQLRKTPIVVNDSRGFYTSRVFQTYIHEGMVMLQEGIAPALIENAGRLAGMPTGPLAVCDEVSLDLPLRILIEAEAAQGAAHVRPQSYDVLRRMVEDLKRAGRKVGAGFYDYPAGGRKHIWPGLADVFPVRQDQPDVADVKKRLLYIQSLETARCLEEGVLTDPIDGDLGSVFGWGFPAYLGGTISLIDTVGLPQFVAECDALGNRLGPRFLPSVWLRGKARSGARIYA